MRFLNSNFIIIFFLFNTVIYFVGKNITLSLIVFFLVYVSIYFFSFQQFRYNINNKLLLFGGYFYFFSALFLLINGFFYGYPKDYYLLNFVLTIVILLPFFLKSKFLNFKKIAVHLKIISLLTTVLSILMFFFREQIPILNDLIEQSQDADQTILFKRSISEQGNDLRTFRATGLFKDAFENGMIMLFGSVLFIQDYIKKKKLFQNIIPVILLIIGIYTTQTRNIFLLGFIVLFIYFISSLKMFKERKNYFFVLLCIIYVIELIIIFTYISYNNTLETGKSIFSRVYSWKIIFQDYILDDFLTFKFLFGYGITQIESDAIVKEYWLIDNSILSIFLSVGFIGIVLFLIWVRAILKFSHKVFISSPYRCLRSNARVVIVLTSILFIGGTMNTNLVYTTFVIPFLILLKALDKENHDAEKLSIWK
mgnify:CR=1 FL=1|tara:strand:+ start:43895 stop:45163 length:1269 start_codon:yes stop_codon:yes gene_type:complete